MQNKVKLSWFGIALSLAFLFTLPLRAADTEPPYLTASTPADGDVVNELTFVAVFFDGNVTGVDTTDLLINGVAATNLLVVSPREYQFRFPEPPTGAVQIAFASNHGITDQATPPNAFEGANWTCTFDPNAVVPNLFISEFLADNGRGLRDEDGTRADWIEIYNPGPGDVNLAGWSLTDTATNLTKWVFPGMNLGANRYLLVWASEKNRTNPIAPLHTNFRLERSGEYLGLIRPSGSVASAFSPAYPAQTSDISYGRDRVDPDLVGYFITPTPGAQNSVSGSGLTPEPVFSLESGVYSNNSLTLSLSAPAGISIRYTLDGSQPTNNSPTYSSPITFTTNMMIKARAFSSTAGVWPSPVVARTFVMLDSTARDFNSNLPLLIISTQGRPVPADLPPGAARPRGVFVAVDTFRGRSSIRSKTDHQGFGSFEIVGQTSAGFLKRPIRIELNDELGNDQAASVLGLPAEADWMLRNPYNDKTLLNDFLGYELWADMGRYSCRSRLVELFLDTGGGKVTYPGDYYGVMVLFERIEIDDNRVNIARLTPSMTNEPAITGGYIIKKDKDSAGDTAFTTLGGAGHSGQTLKFHDPKPREINVAQSNYIRNYVRQFESSMYAANWTNATGTNHYSHYIDVDAFVDQQLHVEFTKQIDGYRLSSYYSKDRNGKLKPDPVWDWNLAFGNAYYLRGGTTNGWYWNRSEEGMGSAEHIWLRRLVYGNASIVSPSASNANGPGDPDFRQKITDRWGVVRTNILNGDRVVARIDELATRLTEAAGRNYQKYSGLLQREEWPNPNGAQNGTQAPPPPDRWHVNFANQPTYAAIISEMKKWVRGRYLWMDGQFLGSPGASLVEGQVPAGTTVTLSAPAGTIYYTLDGTDPRRPLGGISPTALTYSEPIVVNSNVRLFARAYLNPTALWTPWSAPTVATYVVQTPKLIISEIMYHPAVPAPGDTNETDNFEYIEVKNIGSTPLNLNRFQISGGVDFQFGNVTLAAGQSGVLVSHTAAFQSRYGTGALILGQYTNRMANEGERLVLEGPMKEPILDFEYDDDWYLVTDGLGFSLVVVDENAAPTNTAWGLKSGWRPSGALNGTPGANDPGQPSLPSVVINEALTHTDLPQIDAIELRNLGSTDANIGGWFLSDDFRTPKKYRFPNGTMVPANGYLVVYETNFSAGLTGFALSSMGDEVFLLSADINANLTGYAHGFDFGPQLNGVTFGRHIVSTGEDQFVAQTDNSLGAANAGPRVGPIVVTEINYHPVDIYNQYGAFDNDEDEYIELYNNSGSTVALYDATTNRWRLRDAVDFIFPETASLPAGGFALVVGFDPSDAQQLTAFRTRNLVSPDVPIYGPYSGKLDNSRDSVELVRPDVPDINGIVPYVLADKVRYADTAPWPVAADGIGPSLQRTDNFAYGNDPASWIAAGRSPGASYVPGPAPNIVQHPQNQTAIAYDPVVMSVLATGQGTLSYQWRLNGTPLFGQTGPDLMIPVADPSQEGMYDVIVMSGGGAVVSSPATLTLRIPIRFTTQPRNTNARPATPVTLSVAVVSTAPPVSYQWYHNDSMIPAATDTSYSIPSVGLQHQGDYYCRATDGIKGTNSAVAKLLVLVNPLIIVHPLSQDVPYGGTATLSVTVSNSVTFPIGYRWRRSGATVAFNMANDYTSVLNVFNVTNSAAVNYTVVVTNVANTTGILSQSAGVRAIADTDGDGIPDEMEQALGLNANDPDDASTDADGDTMTNLEEYVAGTIHTNAQSYLKVDQISAPGSAILEFSAVSNRTYTVQYTDDVGSGLWSKLSSISARTTNHVGIVVDDNPSPARIYRLATPAEQ